MKRTWTALALFAALAGCATTPAGAPASSLFHDEMFEAQAEPISAEAVFARSPQMLAYIDTDIAAELLAKGRQQGLFDALYRKSGLKLDYESTMTRNAAEAFAARSGNCLSLVLMTAAFAKQLGLAVRYQSVYTEEAWTRDKGLNFLNGHVNVTLAFTPKPHAAVVDRRELLIDFMPVDEHEVQRIRVLPEATIVAMYMNNRAVELLADGELGRAYWWTRAAIGQDEHYLPSTNTLAVIYKTQGDLKPAEQALQRILDIEPGNTIAMGNLATVYRAQGRGAEADDLDKRLSAIRPSPPFHFFDLGEAAMRRGDFAAARAMFARELQRDAYYDKFHASLALALYGLGDLAKAQAEMTLALRHSTTSANRELYAAQLGRLKAGQKP